MTSIYVIPDTQVRPGVRNPLISVAYHIAEIQPDYVIHLGDHWDMPSLSLYDKGKKSHRAKSYLKDIRAGNRSMEVFFEILDQEWKKHKTDCKKIILKGNHEHRRDRALEYGPDELIELMEEFDYDYTGWDKVIPFLKVITIAGVDFSHYFQNEFSGRPLGSARQILMKRHCSSIAGHKQTFDYAEAIAGNGRMIQSLIVGSCYYHDEEYKGQSNHHFRGTVLLENVKKGEFDFTRFSLKNL